MFLWLKWGWDLPEIRYGQEISHGPVTLLFIFCLAQVHSHDLSITPRSLRVDLFDFSARRLLGQRYILLQSEWSDLSVDTSYIQGLHDFGNKVSVGPFKTRNTLISNLISDNPSWMQSQFKIIMARAHIKLKTFVHNHWMTHPKKSKGCFLTLTQIFSWNSKLGQWGMCPYI